MVGLDEDPGIVCNEITAGVLFQKGDFLPVGLVVSSVLYLNSWGLFVTAVGGSAVGFLDRGVGRG